MGQAFLRRFLGFSAVVAAQRVMGRTKNKARRFPFHVESSLMPLRFWSCSWSLRRDYRRKSQEAPGYEAGSGERVIRGEKRSKSATLPPFQLISVNSPRGRAEKTWLLLAGSNQNDTNTTNQIPRLSSVRVRQTNNECAQAYLPLCSPFSTLGPSSFPSACNHFWLALTLCQYQHPRWRQSSFPWLVISSIYEKWAQK